MAWVRQVAGDNPAAQKILDGLFDQTTGHDESGAPLDGLRNDEDGNRTAVLVPVDLNVCEMPQPKLCPHRIIGLREN